MCLWAFQHLTGSYLPLVDASLIEGLLRVLAAGVQGEPEPDAPAAAGGGSSVSGSSSSSGGGVGGSSPAASTAAAAAPFDPDAGMDVPGETFDDITTECLLGITSAHFPIPQVTLADRESELFAARFAFHAFICAGAVELGLVALAQRQYLAALELSGPAISAPHALTAAALVMLGILSPLFSGDRRRARILVRMSEALLAEEGATAALPPVASVTKYALDVILRDSSSEEAAGGHAALLPAAAPAQPSPPSAAAASDGASSGAAPGLERFTRLSSFLVSAYMRGFPSVSSPADADAVLRLVAEFEAAAWGDPANGPGSFVASCGILAAVRGVMHLRAGRVQEGLGAYAEANAKVRALPLHLRFNSVAVRIATACDGLAASGLLPPPQAAQARALALEARGLLRSFAAVRAFALQQVRAEAGVRGGSRAGGGVGGSGGAADATSSAGGAPPSYPREARLLQFPVAAHLLSDLCSIAGSLEASADGGGDDGRDHEHPRAAEGGRAPAGGGVTRAADSSSVASGLTVGLLRAAGLHGS